MKPPDEDLAEELTARMTLYDAALAEGADPMFLKQMPLSSPLEPQWRQLENCLRLLRRTYPSRPTPPPYPGLPTGEFGRFHIRREIGRGGFGIVFLADDPQLRRPVALKLPRPETLVNDDLRRRFLREARAAAVLDHPNLVTVYESGEVNGICYIASAYCPGVNLAQWLLQQEGPIAPRTAATLIVHVAEAVQHAHTRGVLHRDLKPSNILLVPRTPTKTATADSAAEPPPLDFVPKLTDFGLARLLEADAPPTTSGVILGTPAYMAPEQAEGWVQAVGAPTDIYALGVVLYELLTRRLPCQGSSLLLTLDQLRSQEPMMLRRVDDNLPRDLETICAKCLRKDPRQRYASADALAKDLHRFLRGEPIHSRPPSLAARLLDWCRQPPRIRDAALVALFNGTVAGIACCIGLSLFLSGILPSDRPIAAALLFLAGIFGEGLSMIWLSRATSPRRLAPLWTGVFLPFLFPLYVLAAFAQWVDDGGMSQGSEQSARYAQFATVVLFGVITSLSYLLALMAYYANRHRPDFAPLAGVKNLANRQR